MIPGFVLAGGASRRAGSDKARHPSPGRWPMAAWTAGILAAAGCGPVAIVRSQASDERFERPLESWVPDPGAPIPILLDGSPFRHPLWGAAAALRTVDGPCVLVATDLPGLTVEAVRALIASAGRVVACDPEGRPGLLLVALPEDADRAAEIAEREGPIREWVDGWTRIRMEAEILRNRNVPVGPGPVGELLAKVPAATERIAAGERARLAARGVTDPA